ncbi:MAG: ATP phosphoribosyltransferase [Nitrososphaerota archaeon]
MAKVRFAIPKGSLEAGTYKILERAGYEISGSERTYKPTINDPNISVKILRPQEIPILVSEGIIDIGITGEDWILETETNVEILLKLGYGKVDIALIVPKSWNRINSLSDLIMNFYNERKNIRISTEYLNIASKFISENETYKKIFRKEKPTIITPWWKKGNNKNVTILLSFGATEAKPPEDADAIIDAVETGITIEKNNLKIIEKIMESQAVLIASKNSLKNNEKREKIYDVLTLLKGVVEGKQKLHIFVNVKEENLPILLKSLPALKSPTISKLSIKGWYAVNTVIDKSLFIEILPKIRKIAQGLVIHEPKQVLSLDEIYEKKSEE